MRNQGLNTIEGTRKKFAKLIRDFNKKVTVDNMDIQIYRVKVYAYSIYLSYLLDADYMRRLEAIEKKLEERDESRTTID